MTIHGRPSAVFSRSRTSSSSKRLLAVMRDSEALRRLAQSDAELARGEAVSADDLAETIRRRRASE